MSVILLEQKIIHYETLGRGRPVIFLHGWVGSWRYWVPSMQAASTQFRTYALDLWGFGDTSKDKSKYPLEFQVNLVNGFLDHMGIGRVALVGHGLGAVVALLYAAAHQDVVDRMMVISTPLEDGQWSPRLANEKPVELADWLLDKTKENEPVRAEVTKADPLGIRDLVREVNELKLYEKWKEPPVPCLMVYSQNDPLVQLPPPNAADELAEKSHTVYFEQSGHFAMLSEANKFNRLLMDFLTLKSGESPRQLQLKEEWVRRIR